VIRVCAWCNLFLGLKAPVHDWRVTHGICESCRAHVESDCQIVPPPSGPLLILSRRPPPGSEPFGLPPEIVAARPTVRLDRRGVDLTQRSAYRGPDRRAPGSDVPPRGWMLVRPSPVCVLCSEPIRGGSGGHVSAGHWAHFLCAAHAREPKLQDLWARSAEVRTQANQAVQDAQRLRLAARRLATLPAA